MLELDTSVIIGSRVTFSRIPTMLLRRVKRECLSEFTISAVKALVNENREIKLIVILKEIPDVYVDGDCLVLKEESLTKSCNG